MYEQKNKEKGITLIALVVSIILLIILAGVSIAMLVGENGIITQAQRADELTTQAQQKEAIELAVASVQAQGTLELDKTKLETALQSQLGDTIYTLIENGDGSFQLQIVERSYYIDSTGEVITGENMIAIGSAEELKAFRDDVNSGNTYEGKYVYLTSDITLDINEEWEPIGVYPMENDTPDDETNRPFSGIFDGKGYEVNGIYINTADKVQGLFGLVKKGKIKNLGIGSNCNINCMEDSVGAICGYLYDESEIINSYNNSNVIANAYIGGIAGQTIKNSSIENCYNKGVIQGNGEKIAGISGNVTQDSVIQKSCNFGEVIGETEIAGIAGYMSNSYIYYCYNNAKISGNMHIGGILGQANLKADLKGCYNIGNIVGSENVGGILGHINIGGNLINVILEKCYSLENVAENLCGTITANDKVDIKESNILSEEQLKTEVLLLENNFKNDTGINNGYPILAWQRDPTMGN